MTEYASLSTEPQSLDVSAVTDELAVDPDRGLNSGEAARRGEAVGPNRLPEPPRPNIVVRFARHFKDVLIYVLLGAAALSALMQHWVDTVVILAVVVINAAIGFIQEGRSEQALAGLRQMLSPGAHVRRDGEWLEIPADDLVPGDVVQLRAGDRVPADLRLISSNSLRIEESALTGESDPVEKGTEPVDADAAIGDRVGMAFSSTMVTNGSGAGVVTATGQQTEVGHISAMLSEVQSLETPLIRQINRVGKRLSMIILLAAGILVLLGWVLHDMGVAELVNTAIGFSVALIPEGLPAILTITLARGVQVMAGRNAITRRLPSVETLGAVTTICSDKTGTLTKNEMTARTVVTTRGRYDVEGLGYAPEGRITVDDEPARLAAHTDLASLVEVMAIANDTRVRREEGDQWVVSGDPTEGALRVLATKADFDGKTYEREAEIPFDSADKYMAVLAHTPEGERRILLKGAPDRLLDRCDRQGTSVTDTEPLNRGQWEDTINDLSRQGLRVLAAAARPADSLNTADPGDGFVLLGVVGILDPPRPEAIVAIEKCRSAGIKVKMITGDHAGTAEAIGRELGLADDVRSITGAELEHASDEELQEIATTYDVFARTSPEDKLRLVTALQARGEVVAMTGDGVNDAPALRRADVGVAMGVKGTEVTKEAADIVLADDNFSSIEKSVEEGRTIYDNLRKAILYMLPSNGGQGFVIVVAVLAGLTLPLTPLQILWVNLVTAVTLAIPMAFEPSEPGIMDRPPRDPRAGIMSGRFVWLVFFVSALIGGATIAVFAGQFGSGIPLEQARTVAVNTLVFGQVCYLFNARFLDGFSLTPRLIFSNRVVWVSIGILMVLQLVFVYAPFMHAWFGSAAVPVSGWVIPAVIGVGILFIVEAEKAWVRRLGRR